jgi:rhodanese-related sulfurtransferase
MVNRRLQCPGSGLKEIMYANIERTEVQRLMAQGAQLVDVLPADEYREAHLPGAINVPLKQLNRETTRQLDPSRPVITYCYDYL